MQTLKKIALLMYLNAKGLPYGIKMLAAAALIVSLLKAVGQNQQVSWAISLAMVIPAGCVLTKFPTLIGKSK